MEAVDKIKFISFGGEGFQKPSSRLTGEQYKALMHVLGEKEDQTSSMVLLSPEKYQKLKTKLADLKKRMQPGPAEKVAPLPVEVAKSVKAVKEASGGAAQRRLSLSSKALARPAANLQEIQNFLNKHKEHFLPLVLNEKQLENEELRKSLNIIVSKDEKGTNYYKIIQGGKRYEGSGPQEISAELLAKWERSAREGAAQGAGVPVHQQGGGPRLGEARATEASPAEASLAESRPTAAPKPKRSVPSEAVGAGVGVPGGSTFVAGVPKPAPKLSAEDELKNLLNNLWSSFVHIKDESRLPLLEIRDVKLNKDGGCSLLIVDKYDKSIHPVAVDLTMGSLVELRAIAKVISKQREYEL